MPTWLFLILAAVAVAGAGVVVLHRNPVKSALSLVVVLFTLAVLYLGLSASFLAVIQVLVYAGAVMVLFLFVLFLLNVGVESPFSTRLNRRLTAGLVGILMGLTLAGAFLVRGSVDPAAAGGPPVSEEFGTIEAVGELLFTRYILPFELLSVLLLVAIVGAVIAARPRWPVPKVPDELWPEGLRPGGATYTSGGEVQGPAEDAAGDRREGGDA
ncbi:MAG: NADH-quinone oxidoreductase subunit J [bacterium]